MLGVPVLGVVDLQDCKLIVLVSTSFGQVRGCYSPGAIKLSLAGSSQVALAIMASMLCRCGMLHRFQPRHGNGYVDSSPGAVYAEFCCQCTDCVSQCEPSV